MTETKPTERPSDNIEVVNGFFNVVCGGTSYGFRASDLKYWQYDHDSMNFTILTASQRIVLTDYKNVYAKQFARMVSLCYPVVNIELVKP